MRIRTLVALKFTVLENDAVSYFDESALIHIVLVIIMFLGQFCARGKRAMRLNQEIKFI